MIEFWTTGLQSLALLALALLLGGVIHAIVYFLLPRVMRGVAWDEAVRTAVLRHTRLPTGFLFPIFVAYLVLPVISAGLPGLAALILERVLYFCIVAGMAWLFVGGMSVLETIVAWRFDVDVEDNLRARKVVTQTRILKRVVTVGIIILAVALVLLRFEGFRELGTGILASAGIIGLVVGIAAQRTLGNLLAGFQIAITQPIRVDDVVIVEGDFGWVEEITLTYVVVRVWDLRRIVVPISYFIENPFQNWTRTSSDLLGTVFLYVDYTVPVGAVREKHREILEASDQWDEVARAVQVTDSSERTVEIRCLQSAASAPKLFELRCKVREEMIAFLQEEYPEALPKVRAELDPGDRGRPTSDEVSLPPKG